MIISVIIANARFAARIVPVSVCGTEEKPLILSQQVRWHPLAARAAGSLAAQRPVG